MKITCTKEEFTRLVRACASRSYQEYCYGCVFSPMCSQDQDMTEDYEIMVGIEDICEIVGDQ